jgi:hypothetical protein
MDGENTDDVVDGVVVVVSTVVVVSVEIGVVSVELLSLGAVDVESVGVPPSNVMPRAPEATIPALSRAPSASTIPARGSVFRPFISPAPLLPRSMRRIE